MSKTKVSIKDIAQKAGVSTALVSYVLNGKEKESRVGQEIALKIKQIASELNYQPSHLAKSLRSGKTHTIGLIIADISNPFFANIARVVEDEAKRYGYTVIIGSSDENAEKSQDLIDVLVNRQVDGFIIVSAENSDQQVQLLKNKHIPFVLLDRYFPEIATDFVSTDHYKASYDAGTHLVRNKYKHIGMIAYDSQLFHMKERIRGYRDALQDNNITHHSSWLKEVRINDIESGVKRALDEMLSSDQPIDALLFATYSLAVSGLKYINKLGLKVPDELAIVSFGQAEVFELYYCPITYLKQPIVHLGQTAVELLINKLKNKPDEPAQILMQAELIERASSKTKKTLKA
ncbi:LacI family DNA-binding transcriptional regulator [Spirosoma radiotolerans]|uniref:LacI family transcriptional regulator n=1 Tax=Spirosoma radiotolerans TaxID=1379870 RepID=A0A0E3ZTX0_9BACT|nr:LacI family DNA-binding transcriptional regulator [Spirosoma radiotolerans]AKD54250.1 LacI family transcriptional regulator [Spirosoma radiotolerans]